MEEQVQHDEFGLTDLGRVITRRKELGIPMESVASIVGVTRQRWHKIEENYEKDHCSERKFSSQQMYELNRLLAFDTKDLLCPEHDAMVFSESKILDSLYIDAKERDVILTKLVLECICRASEDDLTLLQQTTSLLVSRDSPYGYDPLLVFHVAIRKRIVHAIQSVIPNRDAIDAFIASVEDQVKKEMLEETKNQLECNTEEITKKEDINREEDEHEFVTDDSSSMSGTEPTANNDEFLEVKRIMKCRHYAAEKAMDSLMWAIKNEVRAVVEEKIAQRTGRIPQELC